MKQIPEKRNEVGTIVNGRMVVHALYADDFLHFTDNPQLYHQFKDLQRTFNIKSGPVSVYLGNRLTVDHEMRKMNLSQKEFVDELLDYVLISLG